MSHKICKKKKKKSKVAKLVDEKIETVVDWLKLAAVIIVVVIEGSFVGLFLIGAEKIKVFSMGKSVISILVDWRMAVVVRAKFVFVGLFLIGAENIIGFSFWKSV